MGWTIFHREQVEGAIAAGVHAVESSQNPGPFLGLQVASLALGIDRGLSRALVDEMDRQALVDGRSAPAGEQAVMPEVYHW